MTTLSKEGMISDWTLTRRSIRLPGPAKNVRHGVVPFVTGVFKNRTCGRDKRVFHRPILRESGGVVDSDPVQDRVGVHPPKPFDDMQVLSRSAESSLVGEIGSVHHQRVAVPMANRVPKPLVNALGRMRSVDADNTSVVHHL